MLIKMLVSAVVLLVALGIGGSVLEARSPIQDALEYQDKFLRIADEVQLDRADFTNDQAVEANATFHYGRGLADGVISLSEQNEKHKLNVITAYQLYRAETELNRITAKLDAMLVKRATADGDSLAKGR